MLGSHGFPKCTNTVICIGGLWHDNTLSNFALKPFNFINRKAILLSSLLILLIGKLALNFRKNYCHYCNPFSVSDPDPGAFWIRIRRIWIQGLKRIRIKLNTDPKNGLY